MKKKYWVAAATLFLLGGVTSCVDLDITPTSIVTDNDIFNDKGIKAYFAGVYNHLPMEDFKYDINNGSKQEGGYFVGNGIQVWTYYAATGEMVNRNNTNCPTHKGGYWSDGFKIIRQANSLIKKLPEHPELANESKSWIAEAKFIRAYVYFQLAKRYGGLPIIEEPQELNLSNTDNLNVPRSSHEATYDFILKDLDDAIADLPETSEAGRANKFVAAGMKSRVALYAATTARYGSEKFPDWSVDGVLLEGIPSSKANDYFKQAWDATQIVVNSGRYELHRGNADKEENYAEVWEKSNSNKESIWLRLYDYNANVHSYNSMMAPPRMCSEGGDRFNPTLDWVELFDGLPLNSEGHFSAFDKDGNYLVYDNCQQIWENAEPRLKANLLIPGRSYKGGMKLDLRAGLIKEEYDPATSKFKKFSVDDGAQQSDYNSKSVWNKDAYENSIFRYQNPNEDPAAYAKNIMVWSSNKSDGQTDPYERPSDGVKIFKNGLDGPKINRNTASNTITGFFGRKYLDITVPKASTVHFTSTQPWIEMRYAEILLNRAEAEVELAQNGVANYGGVDMLEDAYNCINDLRDRAGATLLGSPSELSTDAAYTNWSNPGPKGQGGFVEAPNRGLQIVRVERYKELAFEAKIYWDLRRWFTFDTQIRNYRRRGLYSFMFAKGATVDESGIPDGKYIYDAKSCEEGSGRVSWGNVSKYYDGIPSSELKNNPLLQKNRNQ